MNFLSLDVGTTCCKCQLFSERGEILAYKSEEYPLLERDGEKYVDVAGIFSRVKEMMRFAATRGGFSSMCISTFGESFVLLDKDGDVLFLPMLYTDPRGEEEAEEILQKFGAEELYARVGVLPQSMFSLSKLLWIKKHAPEVFERADEILLICDYLGYLLTGERAVDYGLATRTGDGVILCMPIFIDENGAAAALQDANVPILMQAYPDEIGKMDFAHRRDAFCGKFSVTDVFYQYKIPFTVMKPHVVHPLSEAFRKNLEDFAAVCRVVKGMRRFNLGCIGARTTAFKTVRFDEVTLQRYGINVESFDLSELVFKVGQKKDDDKAVLAKVKRLESYTDFSRVPEKNKLTLAKISVVIDEYIDEYKLDAITLRCWNEMETILRVCPCVLISELNDRGIVCSCEIDLCSAITMRAMNLASGKPTACLDWNNNYGDDENKVILFHCGPVAQSLMAGKGTVTEHKMFAKGDPGSGWGSNEGRIAAFDMTFSNCFTENGKLKVYASEARFTGEPIEKEFFGCGGVAEIPDLQNKLLRLARGGFKHHTTVGVGHMKAVLEEAFSTYLGYDIVSIEE